jgi:hypothetical protein
MKMLLWKEIQENLKWAVIATLFLFGFMAYFGVCLCDSFFMTVSFISAVFGGVLGFLQMTFESHGDRRALLLHRPISRTSIFLAKVISGSALYLLAMGLPLVYYLATAFIPGQVAPQLPLWNRWPLVTPWFADILTGLIYYLAGALAGLRPGRWYGSRSLGFPVAILATFLSWNLSEFREVLLAHLLLGSVLGLAAWGSFLTAGDTDSQPLLAKFGLASTFLIGLSVLSIEGKAILENRLFHPPGSSSYTSYQVNRDGQIWVTEFIGNELLHVRNLAGRELEEHRYKSAHDAQIELAKLRAPSALAYSEAWHSRGNSYRTFSQHFVRISNQTTPHGESWGYVPSLGQVVGFDTINRQLIGRFGPDGFTAEGETPRSQFSGPLDYSPIRSNPDYLTFPTGVYDLDFENRQVRAIFTPANGEYVIGARNWSDDPQSESLIRDEKSVRGVETYQRLHSEKPNRVVVGTNQAIYVLNQDGHQECAIPVEYDSRQYMFSLLRFDDPSRYAVMYRPSYFLGLVARESMESHQIEYGADGHELSRTTLPALPFSKPLAHQPWFGTLTSPAEAVVLLTTSNSSLFRTKSENQAIGSKLQLSVLNEFYRILPSPRDLAEGLNNSRVRLYAIGLALNGVLGAVGCMWISRRLALAGTQAACWLGFGLIFGVTGGVLMACVHEWPARVSCPKCRKLRLVSRIQCEHCGSAHPPSLPDGTEVFAMTTA